MAAVRCRIMYPILSVYSVVTVVYGGVLGAGGCGGGEVVFGEVGYVFEVEGVAPCGFWVSLIPLHSAVVLSV